MSLVKADSLQEHTAGAGITLLSALVRSTLAIAAATVLDNSAFNSLLLCSGTSYAVTLPPAAANAGKSISLKMLSTLTGIVTVTAAGADLIDGLATRALWAGDMVILLSDGTKWTKIGGIDNPKLFVTATKNGLAAQAIPNAAWTQITLAAITDPYGMFNAGTSKFTLPKVGLYRFDGGLHYQAGSAWAAGSSVRWRYYDGTISLQHFSSVGASFTGDILRHGDTSLSVTAPITTVEMDTYQDSAAAQTLVNNGDVFLSITWLGGW